MGLRLSYPSSSYEELLAKYGLSSKGKNSRANSQPSTGLFGSLFKKALSESVNKDPQREEAVQITNIQEEIPKPDKKSERVASELLGVDAISPMAFSRHTIEETRKPDIIDLSNIEDIENALDQIVADQKIEVQPILKETPSRALTSIHETDANFNLTVEFDSGNEESHLETFQQEDLDLTQENQQPPQSLDSTAPSGDSSYDEAAYSIYENLIKPDPIENPPLSVTEEILPESTSRGDILPDHEITKPYDPPHSDPPISVASIFDELIYDLDKNSDKLVESEIELGIHQLRPFVFGEEYILLFDLAEAAIDHPDDIARLSDEINLTEKRAINAESLNKALEKTEAILSIPKATLKNLGKSAPKPQREVSIVDVATLPKAGPATRFFAFLVDLTLMLILSTVTLQIILSATADFEIDQLEPMYFLELTKYFGVAVATLFFWVVFYPTLAFLILKNTLGTAFFGIDLVNGKNKPPRLDNIILRSVLFPLSLVLLGFLPVLWSRQTLHDWLSRTWLIKSE